VVTGCPQQHFFGTPELKTTDQMKNAQPAISFHESSLFYLLSEYPLYFRIPTWQEHFSGSRNHWNLHKLSNYYEYFS